ncbi:adenylyltransferase [candidate division MSBL1 archaeon SCGC-AAA259E19]|uniref:Adenylyltransferase n=1 Tax=candidate division MSBL1 archaeon SCGC-AAA259E19 TaxID=1698264 RepID=A0A133UNR6_9EURY|nr:adenylyltransferase [candidate division MSBL1 archaeon SCGC-AAA259E19]
MTDKEELKELTEREEVRYGRQIMMEGFGEENQKKLRSTTALVAGAGGLGSPVSIYLAVAGVGRLRIVDNDEIELSNLNRQILYGDDDIGRNKAEVAKEKIGEINKDIEVESVKRKISDRSIDGLVKECDLIVDCMDNYRGRYVLNEASVGRNIPMFHGAVRGMRGQVTTIIPGETPCLRCIVPSPPPPEKSPVVGATAGLIGAIQVHEVIKYILEKGDLLKNRLLLIEGGTEINEVEIHRNLECEVCGEGQGSE